MKKSNGEDQDIAFGDSAGAATVVNSAGAFQLVSTSGSFTTITLAEAQGSVSLSSPASASNNTALVMSALTTGALSKLDSQLAALYLSQSSMAADAAPFTSMVQQFAGSISGNGQYVVVDATAADGNGSALLADLQQIGMIGGSSFGAMASGWVPIDQIGTLAGLSGLNFARESLMSTNVGSVTTQADHALATDTARSTYGVNGAGVKVGIISDSFNFLGGYNANIASGDLPPGVQILQDSLTTDEGRGMAQLIYDIAPGAALAFATANGGQANFANNIIALKNAGAKVIVDDVSYFAEPMFQDGVIAQAVDQVSAAGTVYFAAAANNGHKGYESGFLSSGTTQIIGGKPEILHNFNAASPTTFMSFTVAGNRTASVVLEWNQPAASVSPGHGATSDLDLFVYNASGSVVSISQASNIGRDPIEVVQFSNSSAATQTYQIAVGLSAGAAPSDIKIVTFNGNGTVSNGFASNTNDGTIYGHAAATSAIAVGAAAYAQTPGFGVNPPVIESFSSAGPTRILFDTAGNPISVLRQGPQITAPDGGNTSFFGTDDGDADSFPNFYGTSAAAPAAAAVAALMLQANRSLTPAAIKTALMNSAIDMDNPATPGFDPGFDAGTGAGLIQANAAIAAVISSVAINDVTITEGDSGTQLATFTVTRSSGNATAFAVNFATADGTATTADHDYAANAGTLNFGVGVNTQTISVVINGDTKLEPSETFFVNLSATTNGAVIGDGQGIGTIKNDELNLAHSDFNTDATSDVFWRNDSTGHVGIWEMHNNVPTWHDLGLSSGVDHKVAGIGDFNGDGAADLLWRNDSSGHVGIWEMNNNVPTWHDLGFSSGTDHKVVGIGDFNGDHTADVLWRNDSTGHVGIWEMHDNVPNGHDLGLSSAGDQKVAGIGDFNGDGTADVLWRNDANGQVGIWEMHNNVPNGHDLGPSSGTDFKVAGIGDFNGDHTADILWRNDANGQVGIWEMHNNVQTWHDLGLSSGTDFKVAGIGDYNGDGTSDIFWRNNSDGHVGIWEMHNNVQTWHDLGLSSGVDHSFIV